MVSTLRNISRITPGTNFLKPQAKYNFHGCKPTYIYYSSQPKGRSNPSDSDQLPPERPGSQSDAAAARHHGAGGGRREYRECVGIHGPAPAHGHPSAETTSPGTTRLDAQGLSTRTGNYHPPVGCFRSTPSMEQRLGRVQDPGDAYSTPRLLLPGDGPTREVPSWIRH